MTRTERGHAGSCSALVGLRALCATISAVCVVAWMPLSVLSNEIDAATGLVQNSGWEQVRVQCGGCHSYGLITNQRGDREAWLGTIRWMQETQNLWQLPEATEAAILDYLAANYPPLTRHRRSPLLEHLRPESGQR